MPVAAAEKRNGGYREQALKIYPGSAGAAPRVTRAQRYANWTSTTGHNHDNNPPDGSNWELLCLYCHDNEHQRS